MDKELNDRNNLTKIVNGSRDYTNQFIDMGFEYNSIKENLTLEDNYMLNRKRMLFPGIFISTIALGGVVFEIYNNRMKKDYDMKEDHLDLKGEDDLESGDERGE